MSERGLLNLRTERKRSEKCVADMVNRAVKGPKRQSRTADWILNKVGLQFASLAMQASGKSPAYGEKVVP